MTFHRYAVPSYFGGLPSGYDYINNAISGTPAGADGAKTGGPNAGTYFVAFGEDATSADVNRPASALAQNTDYLDNLLHRDIALPSRSGDSTGVPTATLLITGPGIFMGLVGAVLTDLFHVTDTNDEDIDVGGTKIIVSSAVDQGGSPVSVGGGFSNGNVLLTFNLSIPSGQSFRVYYGQRTNLATFPADGLTTTRVRNLTEVDYQVEELFRLLHGNSLSWNAAWTSTIYDLTTRGLNGLYDLSTTGAAGAVNTAGAGAVATRTGQALTMLSAMSTRVMPDALNLLWKADSTGDTPVTNSAATGTVGSLGFGALTTRWGVQGESTPAPMVASHASFLQRSQPQADPTTGLGYWTRIPNTATATMATTATNGLYLLTLDGVSESYFWQKDTGTSGNPCRSAMSFGMDMLQLTLAGGAVVTVRLGSFDATELSTGTKGKKCYVTSLDGAELAALPASVTQLTWLTPTFMVQHGAASAKAQFGNGILSQFPDDGIFAVVPPDTVDVNTSDASYAQYRGPQTQHYFGRDTTDKDGGVVLGWGAFNQRDIANDGGGYWKVLGQLNSDGGATVGYIRKPLISGTTGVDGEQRGNYITVSSGGPQTVLLDLDHFDIFWIVLNAANTVLTVNFSSKQTPGNPLQPGKHLRCIIVQEAAGCTIAGASDLLGWQYPLPYGGGVHPQLQGLYGAADVFDIDSPTYTARNTASITRY